MKINKFSISLLLVVLTVMTLSVPSVMGATATTPTILNITIVSPTSSVVLSGNISFNVTMDDYPDQNWSWANVSLHSAGLTANNTYTVYNSVANHSITTTMFNGTMNTTWLEDSNDYIFNVTLWNGSDTISKEVTGLTLDHTSPTTPSSLSPTSDEDGTVNFTATVTDSETTSCTLLFDGNNPGLSSYVMAYSGDSCSYELSGIAEQTYDWYVRASDELNTTDSSTTALTVDNGGSSGTEVIFDETGTTDGEDGNTIAWVIGIIAVILVVSYIIKKK